jgi:hypothetical protein
MDRHSFENEIWKRATEVHQQGRQRRHSGGTNKLYHLDDDPTMSESTTEEDNDMFLPQQWQADTPRSLLVETGQDSDESERNYIRAYRKLIQIQEARSDILEAHSHSSNEEHDDKSDPDETLSSSAYTEEEEEEEEEIEEPVDVLVPADNDNNHEEDNNSSVEETSISKISPIDYNSYRNAVNSQEQKKKYIPSNGTDTTSPEVPKRFTSAEYTEYRQAIQKQQQKKRSTVPTNDTKPNVVDYSAYQNAIQQQEQKLDSSPQRHPRASSLSKSPPSSPPQQAIVETEEEPTPTTTFVLVLSSTLGSQHRTREQRALMWLDSLGIPYQRLDGSDPVNKQQRNHLFEISGLRGEYPQFFVCTTNSSSGHPDASIAITTTNFTSHNTTFLGDYDTVEGIHDATSLPAEILEANPNVMTWDRIPGLQRKNS